MKEGFCKAPWTEEQVAFLNEYQQVGFMHPFTCGNEGCRNDLVATKNGWICSDPDCNYTQDWAHDFMANGKFVAAQLRMNQLFSCRHKDCQAPLHAEEGEWVCTNPECPWKRGT